MGLNESMPLTRPRAFWAFNTIQCNTHTHRSRSPCKSRPTLCLGFRPSWSSEWKHGFIFGTITAMTQEAGFNLWPVLKRLVNRKRSVPLLSTLNAFQDDALLFYRWWDVSDVEQLFLALAKWVILCWIKNLVIKEASYSRAMVYYWFFSFSFFFFLYISVQCCGMIHISSCHHLLYQLQTVIPSPVSLKV